MSIARGNSTTGARVRLTTPGWHTENGVSAKGSAYLNGSLLGAEALCEAAHATSSEEELAVLVERLNGFFSIIVESGQSLFAAVDSTRSIPLFYSIENDELRLSDSAEALASEAPSEGASELIRLEFLLTGYVTGRDTLAANVKQLQSGEYIAQRTSGKEHTRRYFTFSPEPRLENQKAFLWQELDRIYSAAIDRLLQRAGTRQIVVPLSGGYDSRLILSLLKQAGAQNLMTYTYGRSSSAEVAVAKEIARTLGVECRFVEYTNEAWWQWFHSDERQAFFRAAHNLVSLPHLQDWPAVWQLKKDASIATDAIIIPGHTGFVAGSHIPRGFINSRKVTKQDFLSHIFDNHYTLWSPATLTPDLSDALKARIAAVSGFGSSDPCSSEHAIGRYEEWDYQERQAKFIVNSVRVFEFWGYEWWLPFCDAEMMSYWRKVPYEWRVGSRLYHEYAVETYARIANLSRRIAARRAPQKRIEKLTPATAPFMTARYLYGLVTTEEERQMRKRSRLYDRHHLAIFGMMNRDTFNEHLDRFRNFHSFISKAVLEGDFF